MVGVPRGFSLLFSLSPRLPPGRRAAGLGRTAPRGGLLMACAGGGGSVGARHPARGASGRDTVPRDGWQGLGPCISCRSEASRITWYGGPQLRPWAWNEDVSGGGFGERGGVGRAAGSMRGPGLGSSGAQQGGVNGEQRAAVWPTGPALEQRPEASARALEEPTRGGPGPRVGGGSQEPEDREA